MIRDLFLDPWILPPRVRLAIGEPIFASETLARGKHKAEGNDSLGGVTEHPVVHS
ncbi:MAG: hypothetical protein ACODAD_05635 [Planctomycetota bacterium]